jgi:integration host factor subunit alpha
MKQATFAILTEHVLLGVLMALTKNDIVTRVHELGFTKKKSVEIVESLLEIIKSTLEKGDDVLISGFGKFCVKNKNKRRGRNPATGSDLILRERKVVTFKCSGKLRNKINGME